MSPGVTTTFYNGGHGTTVQGHSPINFNQQLQTAYCDIAGATINKPASNYDGSINNVIHSVNLLKTPNNVPNGEEMAIIECPRNQMPGNGIQLINGQLTPIYNYQPTIVDDNNVYGKSTLLKTMPSPSTTNANILSAGQNEATVLSEGTMPSQQQFSLRFSNQDNEVGILVRNDNMQEQYIEGPVLTELESPLEPEARSRCNTWPLRRTIINDQTSPLIHDRIPEEEGTFEDLDEYSPGVPEECSTGTYADSPSEFDKNSSSLTKVHQDVTSPMSDRLSPRCNSALETGEYIGGDSPLVGKW